MKTYTLYVHDGRYAVPTLLTVEMRDDDSVLSHAEQRLKSSLHYQAVEVWDDDRLVNTLRRET